MHDHKVPVFGCSECIRERGPLEKPLTGRVNDIKREFRLLNYTLEKRIVDKDEEAVFTLLNKLEKLIEEIYYEAFIIQSERFVNYVDSDFFGVHNSRNYSLELHKSRR